MAVGVPFAVTLMSILMAHEMGHFLVARRHQVRASLPYFIPFPPYYSVIGTLGAFIRIRQPIPTKRMLFDIGVFSVVLGAIMLALAQLSHIAKRAARRSRRGGGG